MKKIIIIFGAVLFLCGSAMAFLGTPPQLYFLRTSSSTELHTDANAASDPSGNEADATTGWVKSGPLDLFESQSSIVNVGNYAFHANANGVPANLSGFYKNIGDNLSLSKGTTYKVSADVRHSGTGGNWQMNLGNSTIDGSPSWSQTIRTEDTAFSTITTIFAYDSNHNKYLNFRELESNNGAVYVDNVSIKQTPINFSYNVDHPSGTNYAYSGLGAAQAASMTGTAETSPAHGGTYSFLASAGVDEKIIWTSSVPAYINPYQGSLSMWVYIDAPSITGVNPLFDAGYDASNLFLARVNANGTIYFIHIGAGTIVDMNTTATVPTQQWSNLHFTWSVNSNAIEVKIDSNAWESDNDADPVTAHSDPVGILGFGASWAASINTSDDVYYDDITIR